MDLLPLLKGRFVTLDFETYYDKDYCLSKMGPIEYIRDHRFAVLCCAIRVDLGETKVYEADEIADVLRDLHLEREDTVTIGHNIAGFDGLILSEVYGIAPAYIFDTIALARWCGLARCVASTHEAITAALGNGVKEHGTEWSIGRRTKNDFLPETWEKFKQYCHDDAEQCSENFYKMFDFVTEDALLFMSLTASMATRPVLQLDTAMLKGYIDKLNADADASMQKLVSLFQFPTKAEFLKSIRSADKYCAMLRQLGVEPPMKKSVAKSQTAGHDVMSPALSKNDLAFTALLDHPDPRVRLLVSTRLERNSSIELTRAKRLYNLSLSGKPLPVMLQTFSSHTSRYAAGNSEGATDGLNMQNLAKRGSDLTLRKSIKVPKGMKIVACDSSQIEARMLAYIARQDDLVQQFREGRDPYSELAEKIFHIPATEIKHGAKNGDKKLKSYRNVGKTSILSAGYGVGVAKYSDTLLRQGVQLDDDLNKHYQIASRAHTIYRQTNAMIVALWQRGQQIVCDLASGRSGKFGGPNDDLFEYGPYSVLGVDYPVPSIRMKGFDYYIRYPHLRRNTTTGEYEYDFQKGKSVMPRRLYGASLVENVTQGLAFQLLMWQACRVYDTFKLSPIANIHDCWVYAVPEGQATYVSEVLQIIMSSCPVWMADFPVGCEAEIGDDYTVA